MSTRIALLACLMVPNVILAAQGNSGGNTETFKNPVLPEGPDPWVIRHGGFYYYMNSTGNNLTMWKTRSIADLASAEKRVVWTPPGSGPYSHDIWAPELHLLGGRWYIYFAADEGSNMTHRIWVLENSSTDPLQGGWSLKGKLTDPGDHWAIDASVFQSRDHTYMIWSGWAGSANGTQSIYIAELKNPWTLKGDRVKLSQPEYPWEKVGDLNMKRDLNRNPGTDIQDPLHIDVNEGPEILKHDGKIFLIYSASACWTDQYELGMLTASESADLLNATSWQKNKLPVFWESPEAQAYGTGHNAFFKSPDGKQDWIIYHANPAPGEGCGSHRSPRIQPFGWNSDGTPNFGRPVPLDQALHRPSGEVSNR